MNKFSNISGIGVLALLLLTAPAYLAQGVAGEAICPASDGAVSTTVRPKTIYRDSDGNLISNDEFVDIRMANFHMRDATIVKTLADGTVEFRLQKVPQEGSMAPDVVGRFVDGSPMDLAGYRGKVVVLSFWFIGCPSCRAQAPKLNELAGAFAGESDVVFISMTADPAPAVKRYLAANPLNYLAVADARAALKSFTVSGYPKNVVIGRDGRIVYWRSTIRARGKLESVIRKELAK